MLISLANPFTQSELSLKELRVFLVLSLLISHFHISTRRSTQMLNVTEKKKCERKNENLPFRKKGLKKFYFNNAWEEGKKFLPTIKKDFYNTQYMNIWSFLKKFFSFESTLLLEIIFFCLMLGDLHVCSYQKVGTWEEDEMWFCWKCNEGLCRLFIWLKWRMFEKILNELQTLTSE